jgi:formamidopyrimidine-DNA glycosylase
LSPRSSSKFKAQLALFHFDAGTLSLTEAGTQRRASLHLVEGEAVSVRYDRGGAELFTRQKPDRKGGLGKFIESRPIHSHPQVRESHIKALTY